MHCWLTGWLGDVILSRSDSERQRNLMIHDQCPLPVYFSQAEVGFCLIETDFAHPVLSAVLTKNKCDMPKNSIEFISLSINVMDIDFSAICFPFVSSFMVF